MTPTQVVEFWLGPAPDDYESVTRASKRWYLTDDAFDAEIRDRFGAAIKRGRRGLFADWRGNTRRRLGLGDPARPVLAQRLPRFGGCLPWRPGRAGRCRKTLSSVVWTANFACPGRAFLYHPFEHSEDPEDQARSVTLFEALAAEAKPPWDEFAAEFVPYALAHRDVIGRFGRFPHRNAILGRANTFEEQVYLDRGGGF